MRSDRSFPNRKGTMTRHTVLLLTYGEPPSPAFLDQLHYSWRILLGLTRSVAPIPMAVIPLIALKRGMARNRMWGEERYGSPLEPITETQVTALARELHALDPATDWDVRPAYEFRDPLMFKAIRGAAEGSTVSVVPMYAACSAFTHDLSRQLLRTSADTRVRSRHVDVLPPIPEPWLAKVMADHVESELERLKIRTGPDCALLMAAHGTLLSPPRPIETGQRATERLYHLLRERLAPRFGRVQNCWLNHVYGGEWTRPAADVALEELVREGFRRVVYFPYGFLADNAESQLEGTQVLRTQPGLESHHLACLNESTALARCIARQLAGRISLRGR